MEKGPDRSPGKATGFPAAEVFVGPQLIPRCALHALGKKAAGPLSLNQESGPAGRKVRGARSAGAPRVSRDYWPK